MRIDCPIRSCTGQVLTKRVEGMGVVMSCDGPEPHGDSTLRIYAERFHELDEIDADACDELLRRTDPVEFIRDQVRDALSRKGGGVVTPSALSMVEPPRFPTGLGGVANGSLLHYQGMTLLSGKASSGKTWSALRASLDAATDGWEVHYLAAEGAAVVQSRANLIAGENISPRWRLRAIEDGSTLPELADYVQACISSERTLIVVDSFSTALRMIDDGSADPWNLQRRFERFLFNVRQRTAGCVSLLIISEANAAGETKGRSFDHIADLSVNFRADDDTHKIKHIKVVKSWWAQTGDVGRYHIVPHQGGLVRLPDATAPNSESHRFGYAVGGDF